MLDCEKAIRNVHNQWAFTKDMDCTRVRLSTALIRECQVVVDFQTETS